MLMINHCCVTVNHCRHGASTNAVETLLKGAAKKNTDEKAGNIPGFERQLLVFARTVPMERGCMHVAPH